jgi:hypothetical protein
VAGTDAVAPNFIAGYAPEQSDFNSWIQAPFSFLTTKVVFRARMTTAVSLSAGFTQIPYNSILEDPYGGWSPGAGTWTCPAGCGGWYSVTLTAWSNNPGTNTDLLEAVLYLNGAIYSETTAEWGVNGHASGTSGSVIVALYGGQDAISGYVYSSAAVSTPITAGQYNTIEAVQISL